MTYATTNSHVPGGISTDAGNSTLDGIAARYQDAILLLGRIAIAYIFIESAIGHQDLAKFAATFKNFMLPEALGVPVAGLAVLVELLGGIAILVGFRVRAAAVLMVAFVFMTIVVGHRWWEFEGGASRLHFIQMKKNVCIMGGLLALFIAGSGRYAVSTWLANRRR